MSSGRQRARENLDAFVRWAREREAAGDWALYIHGAVLSRSEIAVECGFARSVLLQNPAVRSALSALEERLRLDGVLVPVVPVAADGASDQPALQQWRADPRDRRIETLELRLASLRAENADLRERLRRLKSICDDIAPTGRRLHPGNLGDGR